MEVRIINEAEKELWNQYVYKNPYSIAWHVYEWHEIVLKHYNSTFYPLAAFDNNKIKGILPLFQVGNQLYAVAYAVAGGIVADNDNVSKMLFNKAVEILNKNKLSKITLKQYKIKMPLDLTVDEYYYNKELDLKVPVEKIWGNLDKKNKEILSHFNEKKYNLDFSNDQINEYYKILLNHSHKNGIPCVSEKWIKDLLDLKLYNLATLKLNNKIVAATMYKIFKKTVSFPFSCGLGFSKKNINHIYLLYWMLIKHLKNEGIEIFHSGRIPKSEKTDIYRLGWGGVKHPYFYQYYPKISLKTESKSKGGIKRKILLLGWKILPKKIIAKIQQKIVAKFP